MQRGWSGVLTIIKLFNTAYVGVCFILTKIFFPYARIIRFPIWISGKGKIVLGRSLTVGRGLRIDCHRGATLLIGSNIEINDNCQIACGQNIQIGDGTLIASKVFITDHDHLFDFNGAPNKKKFISEPVKIGRNVWIGNGVSVLKGVSIEDGAVIAANSVVSRSITEKGVYGGVPAKKLRLR